MNNNKKSETPILDLDGSSDEAAKRELNTKHLIIVLIAFAVICYVLYRYRDKWMYHSFNINIPFLASTKKDASHAESSSEDINVFS